MITFKQYLESYKKKQGYYEGDMDLSDLYLFELPDFLKDLIVTGHFWCSYNQLKSLEGSPKEVKGTFNCSYNQLTSLEGSPKEVGRNFYCPYNQLTSLEGSPEMLGGDFWCNTNQLTSLEGCPKEVRGSFECSNNAVQFTEEYVRSLCDVKGKVFV